MSKPSALAPWEITVERARSTGRGRELLERKDADRAIAELTPLEAYYAVKDLGPDASSPLLARLQPEQVCTLFDLDTWHRGALSTEDALLWLSAFREAGTEALARAVQSLDRELVALLFRRRLLVALKPGKEWEESVDHPRPEWLDDPDEALLPLVETPDRRFYVAARLYDEHDDEERRRLDEEERKQVLELVQLLYQQRDWELVAGLLRIAADDLSSALEEDALRFRNGRAADLGFPEPERALEVYGPLEPSALFGAPRPKYRMPPDPVRLPALHAERMSSGLFREAMDTIEDPRVVQRIEAELVPLANAALVADEVEAGDLEAMRPVLDRVRAYLEIALSHETGEGALLQVARARLEAHPLRSLFRVGYTVTLRLKTKALPLVQQTALLGERERAVLAALCEARPSFPTMLEGGVYSGRRAIAGLRDLGLLEVELDAIARSLALAEALELSRQNHRLDGIIDPPLPSERNLDMLIATGAARALLGGRFEIVPLDAGELLKLAASISDGQLPAGSAERAVRAMSGLPEHLERTAQERVALALSALASALAPLQGRAEIDPRFVGGVVRRLA